MEQKLISVVVPVYNVQDFLDRCVESLVSQVYENIEIILIDDGSSDHSGPMCDAWERQDSRIKVIHTPNRGVSSARNTGLDCAQGEYVCFVDSDDYVSRDYVGRMYELIIENHADIALTGYYFSSNGVFKETDSDSPIEVYDYKEIITEYSLRNKFIAGVVCKLFSKEIIEGLRFDTAIRIAEDALFTHLALERCHTIVYKGDALYCYFLRSGSAMHAGFDERYLEWKYVIDFLYERQSALFPDLEPLFYKRKIISYCRKIQDSFSDHSKTSRDIRRKFLCEVKLSSIKNIWRFCNWKERVRYLLIKYFSPIISAYEFFKHIRNNRGHGDESWGIK